ncbi:MAG: type II secretion system protein GspH [Hyphomicrobium sp.]|nr:MAG: type II secretion system protein GspH [Hyphomicrobium sp.]
MTRHGHERAADDDGFTLIELLVVLGVVAVVVLVALPLANAGRKGHELRAAAIAVAAELKSARAAALRSNIEQSVEIDTEKGTYSTSGNFRPRGVPAGISLEILTISSEQSGLATGRLRFYPDGSATGGRVVLRSGTQSAAVTIDWLTGGTRVHWRD